MSWTKRQIIMRSFEEMGFGSDYHIPENDLQSALMTMDSMVASWNIDIGYPMCDSPDRQDINLDTNVPGWAVSALYSNLSVAIAPMYGKVLSQETRNMAVKTYESMLSKAIYPIPIRPLASMPSGAGNRRWGYGRSNFTVPVSRCSDD